MVRAARGLPAWCHLHGQGGEGAARLPPVPQAWPGRARCVTGENSLGLGLPAFGSPTVGCAACAQHRQTRSPIRCFPLSALLAVVRRSHTFRASGLETDFACEPEEGQPGGCNPEGGLGDPLSAFFTFHSEAERDAAEEAIRAMAGVRHTSPASAGSLLGSRLLGGHWPSARAMAPKRLLASNAPVPWPSVPAMPLCLGLLASNAPVPWPSCQQCPCALAFSPAMPLCLGLLASNAPVPWPSCQQCPCAWLQVALCALAAEPVR